MLRNFRTMDPIAFISAVFLYIISIYFSSLRWKLLISSRLSTKRLFDMYMMGSFFNTCLPGIIGGDAVKIFYLGRELKMQGGEPSKGQPVGQDEGVKSPHTANSLALASVFMDRYIGFVALLCIALAAFPFGLREIEETPVRWVLPLVTLSFIVMSIIIFKFRIGERFVFIYRIYEHLNLFRSRKGLLFKCFMHSLVIQLLGFLAVYVLAKGLSISLSFLSILIFLPLIIIISLIPISISGIGLREGAFVFLLRLVGVSSDMAVALSLLWFLSVIAASLWGLIGYLRFKTVLGGEVK